MNESLSLMVNPTFLESFISCRKCPFCLTWRPSLTFYENDLTWMAHGCAWAQITGTSWWSYICFSSQLPPLSLMCPAPCGHISCASNFRILLLPTRPLISAQQEEDFHSQHDSKGKLNIPETLLMCWIQPALSEFSPSSFSLPSACPSASGTSHSSTFTWGF